MTTNADYVAQAVNDKLKGATIQEAVVGDGGFPALYVVARDGKAYWVDVQADAEGNGPGWLNIEAADEG